MVSDYEAVENPKDYTKVVWLGIIAAMALMIVALVLWAKPSAKTSRVRLSLIHI